MKMSRRAILPLALLLVSLVALGQDRCATPSQPFLQAQAFEQWMGQKKFERLFQGTTARSEAEVYLLPVVVHVVHNGEEIGVGGNLSEAKIQQQIGILNEDFRRRNADAINTPSIFQSIAADVEVQFVLAKQNPDRQATNGIVRIEGSQSSYTFSNDILLKQESYWPSEDYINIWVAQVNFLGWATLPETSLQGISNPETNPLFDGVVIDADWFGINDNTGGTFDSFGQTATHEMGHFLGLKHLWGDSNCMASDFCDDTPPAVSPNDGLGSPCSFPGPNSCSNDLPDVPDMFMNYMDYTNDECMNLFTEDQKTRMRTVLENSPRRLSLRTSQGLLDPIVYNLDLAIQGIPDVPLITCDFNITPTIALSNFGLSEINSVEISYSIAGSQTVVRLNNLAMATGATSALEINVQGLTLGSNEIDWEILSVNGIQDEDATNNFDTSTVEVQTETMETPFRVDFTNNDWVGVSDNTSEWQSISVQSNPSMFIDAFENNTGVESWLVSPVFDLSDFEEAGLFFRMSYGIRSGMSDQFEVKVSADCSGNFETVLALELGDGFFSDSELAWEPTEDDDWLDRFIDLDDYVVSSDVRIALVFTNNGGNNFYVDDIELTNNGDSDQPRLPVGAFTAYPNPATQFFNFTLSLPEIQSIRVQLIDMSGAVVEDLKYDGVINQTFSMNTPNQHGVYFLKITGQDINQTQRISINR